ncbi:MAG: hypothetical protein GF334_12325 [Candidatus Altiarchaeales archaeon]|nr:hypothetical protein [Candidatus Altiarchaeales archaeon]
MRNDIMYRDTVFVYPVSMKRLEMGENTEHWATTPYAARCSFQEHALDSQHTDPNKKGSRYVRLFTRHRDSFRWHDKVVWRQKVYLVEKILDHFDNISGQYHHSEIRLIFLEDEDPNAIKEA